MISAGAAVALVALLPLGATPALAAAAVALLTAAGVLIDLDHFVVARLVRGDWANARRAVADPRAAIVDQSGLFGPGDVRALQRLLSHALIAPVAIAAAWAYGDAVGTAATAPAAALAMAVVLYLHVLTDLIWDVWHLDELPG